MIYANTNPWSTLLVNRSLIIPPPIILNFIIGSQRKNMCVSTKIDYFLHTPIHYAKNRKEWRLINKPNIIAIIQNKTKINPLRGPEYLKNNINNNSWTKYNSMAPTPINLNTAERSCNFISIHTINPKNKYGMNGKMNPKSFMYSK